MNGARLEGDEKRVGRGPNPHPELTGLQFDVCQTEMDQFRISEGLMASYLSFPSIGPSSPVSGSFHQRSKPHQHRDHSSTQQDPFHSPHLLSGDHLAAFPVAPRDPLQPGLREPSNRHATALRCLTPPLTMCDISWDLLGLPVNRRAAILT